MKKKMKTDCSLCRKSIKLYTTNKQPYTLSDMKNECVWALCKKCYIKMDKLIEEDNTTEMQAIYDKLTQVYEEMNVDKNERIYI